MGSSRCNLAAKGIAWSQEVSGASGNNAASVTAMEQGYSLSVVEIDLGILNYCQVLLELGVLSPCIATSPCPSCLSLQENKQTKKAPKIKIRFNIQQAVVSGS